MVSQDSDLSCFSARSSRLESFNSVYGSFSALEHVLAFSSSEVEAYQVGVILEVLNRNLHKELSRLDDEFIDIDFNIDKES